MRAICGIVLLLLATSAYAQELTVICKYERSVDDDGKIGGTSGEMSVSVLFILPIGTSNNLKIKTTKSPCYEFVGDGDDMKIRGECLRYLGNGMAPKTKMLTTLKIDRVSGAFEQIVQFNDKGGLTHMGHCTPAARMF
jgi:hypothetical protein